MVIFKDLKIQNSNIDAVYKNDFVVIDWQVSTAWILKILVYVLLFTETITH